MASRYEVEVTVTSANDLKNVNWRNGKLKPYAVVWVNPNTKFSTHVDEEGNTCPIWNEKLTIPFNSPIQDSTLYIDIVHANAQDKTKPLLIGSCKLRLYDIVQDVGFGSLSDKKLELKRPSGRPQGNLDVKVMVRESSRYSNYVPSYVAPSGSPPAYVSSYGVPVPPAYTAPPVGYPYGGYGQPGYGYGQPSYHVVPPGYGYGQKGSKFGGTGTGLAVGAVAGALGGLALAEGVDALEEKIEDDVIERVEDDLGYDGDDF